MGGRKSDGGNVRLRSKKILKDGSVIEDWLIDYYDVRHKRVRTSGFPSQEAAQIALGEELKYLNLGKTKSAKSDYKFNYLIENYLLNGAHLTSSITTIDTYKSIYNTHVKEYFKNLSFKMINITVFNSYRSHLKRKNRSDKTINNHMAFFGSVINYSIEEELISYNPLITNTGKRLKPLKNVTEKEVDPINLKDIPVVLEVAELHNILYHAMLYVLVFTGLRRGEFVALKDTDFNFDTKQVHIQRAYKKRKIIGLPKTKKSNRYIDLSDGVIEIIEWVIANKAIASPYLFPSPIDGDCRHPDAVSQIIKKMSKKSKVPFTVQSCRHTFASLQISQGEDAKYICEQMGHSSIEITYNRYGHLLKAFTKKISKLNNVESIIKIHSGFDFIKLLADCKTSEEQWNIIGKTALTASEAHLLMQKANAMNKAASENPEPPRPRLYVVK